MSLAVCASVMFSSKSLVFAILMCMVLLLVSGCCPALFGLVLVVYVVFFLCMAYFLFVVFFLLSFFLKLLRLCRCPCPCPVLSCCPSFSFCWVWFPFCCPLFSFCAGCVLSSVSCGVCSSFGSPSFGSCFSFSPCSSTFSAGSLFLTCSGSVSLGCLAVRPIVL
jgi:hypothetical protein